MKSLGIYEPICSLICYWNLFEPSTRWEVGVVSCLTLKILGHLLAQGAICDAVNAHWPCLEGPDFEFLKKNHQEWVVHLWLVVSGTSWYFNFQHLKTQCFGWLTTSEISGMLCSRFAGQSRKTGAFGLHSGHNPIPVLYACVCLCMPSWCCSPASLPLECSVAGLCIGTATTIPRLKFQKPQE